MNTTPSELEKVLPPEYKWEFVKKENKIHCYGTYKGHQFRLVLFRHNKDVTRNLKSGQTQILKKKGDIDFKIELLQRTYLESPVDVVHTIEENVYSALLQGKVIVNRYEVRS